MALESGEWCCWPGSSPRTCACFCRTTARSMRRKETLTGSPAPASGNSVTMALLILVLTGPGLR